AHKLARGEPYKTMRFTQNENTHASHTLCKAIPFPRMTHKPRSGRSSTLPATTIPTKSCSIGCLLRNGRGLTNTGFSCNCNRMNSKEILARLRENETALRARGVK